MSASFYPKTQAAFLHRRRDHRPMEVPMQLVADRFVLEDGIEHGTHRAIDLATGARIILAIGTAGGASEQTRWSVRCDWLHRLHHRTIAPLLDFGIVGETSRFEAWRCTEIWQGSPDVARAVRERAGRFFRSNALTTPLDAQAAVYSAHTGAVVLPDTGTGYRSVVDPCREAVSLDTCGISVIARPTVAVLAEMFRAPCGDRPHVTVLVGPAGSGRTTIVGELARTARQHGFVPIASRLVGSRYAEVCRDRSLFIIHRGTANGFSPFLRAMTTTPQPHVLLLAGDDEVRGVDTVAVDRIDPDLLVAAVRPDVEQLAPRAIRAVQRAARHSRGLPGRFVQALWPGPLIDRHAARHRGQSRAAARASAYACPGVRS